MTIINYIPNVKTPTGFDTLNTVSQFTNHVATGVFTNVDTYEINVPAPNDILTGQFVVIFVPDTDSIVGMKISINNGVAIPIDGVGAGSLQTGVATSLLVDTIVGKAYMQVFGVKTPNKNLLHNWDFRSPINQRGASSYSGVGYTIDRWTHSQSRTLSVSNGYIQIGAEGYDELKQFIVNPTKYSGLTVVASLDAEIASGASDFSIYADGVLVGRNQTFDSTRSIKSFTVTLPIISTSLEIRIITAGGLFKLYRVKLELGSVSTLANDPPADYAEQLALCQRYCLAILPFMFVRASNYTSSYIDFNIPIPVSMRTTPSISVDGIALYNMARISQSGFTFSVPVHTGNGLLLRATKTEHGLTDAYMNTDSLTVFSADL